MTSKLTPGQAARAKARELGVFYETLRGMEYAAIAKAAIDAAVASGELVEKKYVKEYSLQYKRDHALCTCGQQWQDPTCTAVTHD